MENNWISVEDARRLPKTIKLVLVYAPNCHIIGNVLVATIFPPRKNKGKLSFSVYDFQETKHHEAITHWMPLPEPPIKK